MKISTIVFLAVLFLVAPLSFAQDYKQNDPLVVYLFSSSTCQECKDLKDEFLAVVLPEFKGAVRLVHIPVDDELSFELQMKYEDYYDNHADDAAKLFAGRQCLSGVKDIRQRFGSVVVQELENKSVTLSPGQISKDIGAAIAYEKFESFSPFMVMLAGIADGINPCAFVTITFLLSMLSLLRKNKKELLIAGLMFSFSVFFTYLILGLGIFRAIKIFSVNSGIANGITIIAFLLAVFLCAVNFFDYLNCRAGKMDKVKLKLPKAIRNSINRIIRTRMSAGDLAAGALVLGFMVSLLESMCTGQVYLPTIVYIFNQNKVEIKALFYLLLYNAMFIVPLLVVFGLAYLGVSHEKSSNFFRRHIAAVKLLLCAMFFILSVLLAFNVMGRG